MIYIYRFVIYLYYPLIPYDLHIVKFICQLSIGITEGIIFSFFISEENIIVDTTQSIINIIFLSGIILLITFYKWVLETNNYIIPLLECSGSWEIVNKKEENIIIKKNNAIPKWRSNMNYNNDVIVEYNGEYYRSIGKYNKITPNDYLQRGFYFLFMFYKKTQMIVKWMFIFLVSVLFVVTWIRNNYWDCMLVLLCISLVIQMVLQLFISFFVNNEALNAKCLESHKID